MNKQIKNDKLYAKTSRNSKFHKSKCAVRKAARFTFKIAKNFIKYLKELGKSGQIHSTFLDCEMQIFLYRLNNEKKVLSEKQKSPFELPPVTSVWSKLKNE